MIAEGLDKLETALHDYHGAINQLAEGLNVTEPPEKPEALALWEQCQALGLPLISGGVIEQPTIWLQEVSVIVEVNTLYDAIRARDSHKTATK